MFTAVVFISATQGALLLFLLQNIRIMNVIRPLFCAAILASFVAVVATGCNPEPLDGGPGTLTLTADLHMNGDSILVGRTAIDPKGNHLRLETFSMYFGGIELLNDTGAVRLSDAERWDAGDENQWTYTVEPGTYEGFRVHIGVPAEFNTDTDPTIWPNQHPLGVSGSAGMFWSWNTGYIFSKFDGKADTTGGTDFTHGFAYHIGGDPQLIEVRYNDPWEITECSHHDFSLQADILDFLVNGNDTIDVRTEPVTHTGDNLDLAIRYVQAQTNAMTLVKQ